MRNLKINKEQYQAGFSRNRDSLFLNIFDESPDAIFLLDPVSFMVIDCNNQALQLFQADKKEMITGIHTFKLYDSEPVEFSRNILMDNVNKGIKHTQELTFKSVKGNVFWGCGTFQRVITTQGKLIVFRVRRVVDYMMTAEMLSTMVKHTSRTTGMEFFRALTQQLTGIFAVSMAMVIKIHHDNKTAEIISCWPDTYDIQDKYYKIQTSPSLNVMKGYTSFYPSHVRDMFPEDELINILEIESFLGAPVFNSDGEVSGLLVMMDRKVMEEIPNMRFIMTLFAARTGAELERLSIETSIINKVNTQ